MVFVLRHRDVKKHNTYYHKLNVRCSISYSRK